MLTRRPLESYAKSVISVLVRLVLLHQFSTRARRARNRLADYPALVLAASAHPGCGEYDPESRLLASAAMLGDRLAATLMLGLEAYEC